MMDVSGVFNKIRNTFSSTVSEISSVLPGNPLLREFDVGDQSGSAGSGLMWKLYNGVKKSTKKEVGIWVFEKKCLDSYNKSDREVILDSLRRGCLQLTKLRHPRVLTVEHSLEESRESLCFCTEPIFASLSNVLGQHLNISNPSKELQTYELHEVEIKYGLMQLSEALAFLHGSAKMVHGNLCPESIIINKGGAWKLAGLDFCISNAGSQTEVNYQCKEWDTSLPSASLPNPNYLAPEYILHKTCDTANDLFSLGALLYTVYNKGKSFMHCTSQDIYRNMSHGISKLEHINDKLLPNIPSEVKEHEKMLLNADPNVRPDAEQMAKLPFFNHVGVMTLQYLDTLLQRDNLQKSQFFKGLPKTLAQLPKRVVIQRVLPCLTSEFSNPDMIPFVLPSIMLIAEDCSKEDFVTYVFPPLIPVFKLQKPVQILLILLQKMELLLSKTPSKMVQNHILPMLSSSLSSSSLQIQELCMGIIPNFSKHLDVQAIKTSIMPKIRHIAIEGDTIAIRIQALVCIGKMVTHFDKWFIQDEVLSFLSRIPSKEPGVLMAILGVYRTVLTSDKLGISKQVMATRSLPFLIPLSVESTLNLKQYNAFMTVIKEMLQRVEDEHRSKLEQLSKMQIEQDSSLDFQNGRNSSQTNISSEPSNVDDILSKTVEEPAPAARKHLTLEEKQRLAKSKEQVYQMKKVGDLKPVNVAKPIRPPIKVDNKPKDLTSTLLENNLSAMTRPMMNQTPMRQSQPAANQVGLTPQPNPFNPQFSTPMATTQWSSMTNSYGMTTPNMQTPRSGFGTSGIGSYRPANSFPQVTPRSGFQSPSSNLNSLETLLPMPSQQKPVSMNQINVRGQVSSGFGLPAQGPSIMNPNKPMSAYNNAAMSQNNSAGNQNLSKQDLLDFLG